jgi:hypothetical protein
VGGAVAVTTIIIMLFLLKLCTVPYMREGPPPSSVSIWLAAVRASFSQFEHELLSLSKSLVIFNNRKAGFRRYCGTQIIPNIFHYLLPKRYVKFGQSQNI